MQIPKWRTIYFWALIAELYAESAAISESVRTRYSRLCRASLPLSKSRTPRNSDSRASSGEISGSPIGSMESTSISAVPHSVSDAHCDLRTHPDSDAARDLSATDSLAKAIGEHHVESLILRSHREPQNEGRLRCVLNRPIDSPPWSRALGTRNALPTPSHKWLRRSPSAGHLSIRTLDPLVVTQGARCGC